MNFDGLHAFLVPFQCAVQAFYLMHPHPVHIGAKTTSSISSSSVFLQAVRNGSSLIQPPGNLEGWKRFKTAVSPAIQRSFSSYHVLFLPAVGGQKFVCIFKIGDAVLVEHVIKHLPLDIHEWERDKKQIGIQKNKHGST
jgi:hypothetical protein